MKRFIKSKYGFLIIGVFLGATVLFGVASQLINKVKGVTQGGGA